MREPWDLNQAFIQNLQQQAAQSRLSADNVLMRMIDQQVNRQNNATAHGYNLDRMRQQNVYATEADTVAYGRQKERDQTAFGHQLERDKMGRGWQVEDRDVGQKYAQENEILSHKLYSERDAAAGLYPGYFSPQRRYGGVQASLAGTESGGNFQAQNNVAGAGGHKGHFGRLQFGVARLEEAKAAKVIPENMTPQQFMASPEAQMRVEEWHLNDIDNYIKSRGLDAFIGQTVGGVLITPEAITAMAHLGGKGGAEKFLRTGGRYNPSDANGTSLRDYAITHGKAGISQGNETSEQRRYSVTDQQSPPTTEILGLPIPNSAGYRMSAGEDVNALLPPWMKETLDAQNLEATEIVEMVGAAYEAMDPLMKEQFRPLITGEPRHPRAKQQYVRVVKRHRREAEEEAEREPEELIMDDGTEDVKVLLND